MRKWIKAIFKVLGVFLILEIVISLLPNRGILRAIREKNLSAVKQSIHCNQYACEYRACIFTNMV